MLKMIFDKKEKGPDAEEKEKPVRKVKEESAGSSHEEKEKKSKEDDEDEDDFTKERRAFFRGDDRKSSAPTKKTKLMVQNRPEMVPKFENKPRKNNKNGDFGR